jgi:hypothetical protein
LTAACTVGAALLLGGCNAAPDKPKNVSEWMKNTQQVTPNDSTPSK